MLFYEFFCIGLLAIGGGAATIPFLFDLSKKYGWFTPEDLTDMIAVSESTPGPIGVNMATFAGFETAGVFGALTATLALVLPSIIIIVLLNKLVNRLACEEKLHTLLKGVQPAVAALILNAAFQIGMNNLKDWLGIGIFISLFLLMFLYKKSPVFYIVLAGALGYLFKL